MGLHPRLRYLLVLFALAWALLLTAEGVLRMAGRSQRGEWPKTRAARFYSDIQSILRVYRRHPFLGVGPEAGSSVAAFGKQLSFNSLGYRSPERPRKKPAGTVRIICAGGSTTLDLLSPTDVETWPWRLEKRLREHKPTVEVWNAGFNGWTSLENLVSLALRDLDLSPDVVVLFQGINDLQGGALRPFDPEYNAHASILVRSLGFELPPIRWWERSLLYERTRDLVLSPENPWRRLESLGPLAPAMNPAAFDTFRRNIRSFLALIRDRDVPVLLVTQSVRVREEHRDADRRWLENWTHLDADNVTQELEKLNNILREIARDASSTKSAVLLADWAAQGDLEDRDFADPAHFSPSGSEKMATFLAEFIVRAGLLSQRDDSGGFAGPH